MGASGSVSDPTLGVQTENVVLEEGQMADPKSIHVPVIKGTPATRNGFEIGYKIGEGSFAIVRLGTSYKTKKKVAIKEVYTPDLLSEQLDDLNKEMNILSQLRHNNIVQLYEVYREDNRVYMILEFLSGGELFDAICEQEYYKEGDARRIMKSITYAILYMHRHGVMHRDLKPENLVLVSNRTDTDVKLIDFGFVTRFGPDVEKETRLCGTPGYIAPEMLNETPYGGEVDVWSLGVILYVLLAGIPPFPTENSEELVESIRTANYSYPDEYWEDVSDLAKGLIDNMLVLDQEKRYTIELVLNHPWMNDGEVGNRDITKNLAAMKEWNAGRKMIVSALAVKSCVKFNLAGKRYRDGLLHAARRAKELESKGIPWDLPGEEIKRRESEFVMNRSESYAVTEQTSALSATN